MRALADAAMGLACPGGCGRQYASTEACMHATCDECGTHFGTCCFGHVNAEDIGVEISACPLNLTPNEFSDPTRRTEQVAVARAVRANEMLASRPDLMMAASFGGARDECEDAREELAELGLALRDDFGPAVLAPEFAPLRVVWALTEVALGRKPDPGYGLGVADAAMEDVRDLLSVTPLPANLAKRMMRLDGPPRADDVLRGEGVDIQAAAYLRGAVALFIRHDAPRRAARKQTFADSVRVSVADSLFTWIAHPVGVQQLSKLQPPWFLRDHLPLAMAVMAWSPKANKMAADRRADIMEQALAAVVTD